MRPQDPDPRAVVAPGEIREIVARLARQSVESVPVHEARTLEALALETGIPLASLRETLAEMRRKGRFRVPPAAWLGFAFLGLFAYWVVGHPPPGAMPPAPAVAPPPKPPEPDLGDTVDLTRVTYGPDAGGYHVDTGFVPATMLPEGISVSATVGMVLWGSGDHRARALDGALKPDEAEAVRKNAAELLRYVRGDASRRRLWAAQESDHLIMLQSYTYSGGGGASVRLPLPGASKDAEAEAAIRIAVDRFVESIQQSLRQQEKWRREQGP